MIAVVLAGAIDLASGNNMLVAAIYIVIVVRDLRVHMAAVMVCSLYNMLNFDRNATDAMASGSRFG